MGNDQTHPSNKQDRRSIRSRQLIIDALRELVLEKEFTKISVKDIVERANVGRATFYAHFEDKNDLTQYLFNSLMTQLEVELQKIIVEEPERDNLYQELVPSLALFRIVETRREWFKKYARGSFGIRTILGPLVNRLEEKLDALDLVPREDAIPRRQVAMFVISALVALVTEWLLEDIPRSPEEMDRHYQTLAEPTLRRLLNQDIDSV